VNVESACPTPLTEILHLERLETYLFRGRSQPGKTTRTFGGEVAGHAVVAAGNTVPADRAIHSAHAHFLLPGDSGHPVVYRVDPVRDGGSFATRRVEAIQHGRVIFHLTASFQRAEDGMSHQVPTLDAPPPEDVAPIEDVLRDDPVNLEWIQALLRRSPVQLRFPEEPPRVTVARGQSAPPRQRLWIRSSRPLPDEPLTHAAALVYTSDHLLLSAALGPHQLTIQDPNLQFATIDHTVWFHAPCRADDWFMYDQEGFWAGSGRALCRGSIFDRTGKLCATIMQEGLLRRR